ncbi:DUF1232 domain-containing protein [Agrobacterium rubi]|nr:DUF1232 domain-containing protein [Agrobacterium rubi]NTF24575.1 DUF1232 domain-containing protein [Agrobacterium rubi]
MVKGMSLPSKDELLATLARSAGKIPFADDVVSMWYCAMDRSTPTKVKVSIIGALAYLVLPVDAIPDVLVGFGFSDDITVLAAVLAMVTSHIKPEHREKARETLSMNTPPTDAEMPIKPMD